MTAPTPVTTSAMVIESGSTRRSTATWNPPTAIHSYRRRTTSRFVAGSEARSKKMAVATPKAATTRAEASQPAYLPSRLPANRLTTNPASGRAGTSQICFSTVSPLQEVDIVDVGTLPSPVHGHDDRQTHDDLRRRDDHREEREHLTIERSVHPGERDEREVHGVQLQLHRHEDHERVLAHENADAADREQRRRDHEEVRDRRPHPTGSSSLGSRDAAGSGGSGGSTGPGTRCSGSGSGRTRRRASTMAATAAMISRIDVTSNGRKYVRNRRRPSA